MPAPTPSTTPGTASPSASPFDASVKSFTGASLVFAIGSSNRTVTVDDATAHNSANLDFTYTVTPQDSDSDGIGVGRGRTKGQRV